MLDILIKTNIVETKALQKINEYCKNAEFYINDSYQSIPEYSQMKNIDAITDERIEVLGLPRVPNGVLRSHRITNMTEDIRNISAQIYEKCEEVISGVYGKKIEFMHGGNLIRYEYEQYLSYHQDWNDSEWVVKNKNPVFHLSSILYINDDYLGGELLLSETKKEDYAYDIMSIKPKAGMIIFFDSLQWHASSPIKSGTKYASTNFYTFQK